MVLLPGTAQLTRRVSSGCFLCSFSIGAFNFVVWWWFINVLTVNALLVNESRLGLSLCLLNLQGQLTPDGDPRLFSGRNVV